MREDILPIYAAHVLQIGSLVLGRWNSPQVLLLSPLSSNGDNHDL